VVPTAADKVLDQLGIPGDERGFTALTKADWFMARVATGENLAAPSPAFPRLELPEEDAG
jgi:methionyl-tRNA synthetase